MEYSDRLDLLSGKQRGECCAPYTHPMGPRRTQVAHLLLVAVPVLLFCARLAVASTGPLIHSVSVSKPFFNPTLGQRVDFSFSVNRSGLVTVLVLDRDGYLVRTLTARQPTEPGKTTLEWNGRDDRGRVVPDEAYSLEIDLDAGGLRDSYVPAKQATRESPITGSSYDRQGGILSYRLPEASRVYIEAGDKSTPALKVIAKWQLRTAGSVIEHWNGFDAAGKTYVPDRPGFAISIRAKPLPENSIITVGSSAESFEEYAARRAGESLLTGKRSPGKH